MSTRSASLALGLSAGLVLLVPGALGAEPPRAQPPTVKGGVRAAVQVTAMDLDVVATKAGQPVSDLTKEEFVVTVDGKRVPIDFFARIDAGTVHGPDLATASPDFVLETLRNDAGATYVPRQFLVYFDDERLLPNQRRPVIEALRDFVTRLSPSDRVSIVSYNGSARVLVPYTSSKEDLLGGLDAVEKLAPRGLTWEAEYRSTINDLRRTYYASGRQAIVRSWAQQTSARDKGALEDLRRSVAALAARSGKRALLLVTNGYERYPGQTLTQAFGPSLLSQFDYDSTSDIQKVISEANSAGITVYPFDAKGLVAEADASARSSPVVDPFWARQNYRDSIAQMAAETGGQLVENRNTFTTSLDRVYAESSSYYSVGVTLASLEAAKGDRKVSVTTTRPGVTVRARTGFSPKTADEAALDRVEMALMTPDAPGDFAAGLTLDAPKPGGIGRRLVPYRVTVPLSELTFTDRGGSKEAVIEVTLAAAEDTGARSRPEPFRKTISIPAADWEKARGESWAVTGEMKTRTGNLRFVAAVRDVASGRVGLASAPVRVE